MNKILIMLKYKRIRFSCLQISCATLFICIFLMYMFQEKLSNKLKSKEGDGLSNTRYVHDKDRHHIVPVVPKHTDVVNADPIVDPIVHSQKVEKEHDLDHTDSKIANVPQDRILDKASIQGHLPKQEVVAPPPEIKVPHLYFNEDGLGQNGKGVPTNTSEMTAYERQLYDQGYERNDFNEYVSSLISVDRSVPESRDPLCWNKIYPTDLPDTSVIICFLNEAWSVLVRSVHSVINTSPPHLLREIILVDDFSDYEYLKAPLEVYMKKFPKVKIVRNSEREGLIRSRLNGAKVATGQVLTFLDSHIECAKDWLPPLLARIKENSSHVVWPGILTIDRDTFEFKRTAKAADLQIGIFQWDMSFTWEVPNVKERETVISPIKSPTMAGGLFSIDRKYFYHIGSYDEEMRFWGGENLEMSFRVWMCGGTVEIIPCSLVGHIFRKRNVNSGPFVKGTSTINKIRTAMVWTDQYKYLFAKVTGHKLENYGNISSRLALRKELKCKSFDWYLTNVYTSVFLPQKAVTSGIIHSRQQYGLCLEANDKTNGRVTIQQCSKSNLRGQIFHVTEHKNVRLLYTCLDAGTGKLLMYSCHGIGSHQKFVFRQDHTILSMGSKKCLQLKANRAPPRLVVCDPRDLRQQWYLEKVSMDFLFKPNSNGEI